MAEDNDSTSSSNQPADNLVFEQPIFAELDVRPVFPDMKLMEETFEHLSSTTDERALAIIGALILEKGIDDLLHTIIPGYKALWDKWDFSLSTKIELARALRLFPNALFNCVDTIRQIRNEFAHDLSVNSLKALARRKTSSKNLVASMRSHYLQYGEHPFEEGYELNGFKILIEETIKMLHFYRMQAWLLNQFIRSKGLVPVLNSFCRSEQIDLNEIGKHWRE